MKKNIIIAALFVSACSFNKGHKYQLNNCVYNPISFNNPDAWFIPIKKVIGIEEKGEKRGYVLIDYNEAHKKYTAIDVYEFEFVDKKTVKIICPL